jgi:hypothetical protein
MRAWPFFFLISSILLYQNAVASDFGMWYHPLTALSGAF